MNDGIRLEIIHKMMIEQLDHSYKIRRGIARIQILLVVMIAVMVYNAIKS